MQILGFLGMGIAGAPDFYCREAQRLRYVARSAFKLLEIQKKHTVIHPGDSILDLGCAPGAWLQVACQSLGPLANGGSVIGVDLKKVPVPPDHCDQRVQTISADALKIKNAYLASLSPLGRGYSVILSDMCPSVSGISSKDAALSAELGMRALQFALGSFQHVEQQTVDGDGLGLLLPGGSLVIKLLESEESQDFPKYCKAYFKMLMFLRPKATRSTSREIYLIAKCRNKRNH